MSTIERPSPITMGYSRQLHNWVQGSKGTQILTWDEAVEGPAHATVWRVVCKLNGQPVSTATSYRKNVAKDAAAKDALIYVGVLSK